MKTKAPKRPMLRYHGGKWILAKWIISHFPKHKIYVEPYGGAASVLLQKNRSYAEIYNDLDDEIVSLFKVVRENGNELKKALELTPFSRKEFELSYKETKCDFEKARRTIVRSFMGFGSGINRQTGFRSNSNRSGTTPAHDWKNYPAALNNIIERLQGVVIENRDASEVIAAHDSEETLIYADPPYLHETRYKGKDHGVYKHEMSNEDHISILEDLLQVKGICVLSGYDNEIYNSYLKDWKKVYKNSFADGAKPRREVLWINRETKNLFSDCL